MYHAQAGGRFGGEALLIGGVVLQYGATRLGFAALPLAESSPGLRALVQWMPILATAMAAAVMRQPTVAVTLVFGSSVACLSLVLGMTTYVGPVQQLPPSRRIWPLVLPAAVFVLLAGFRGHLAWQHALMLLAMGGAFLWVWTERGDTQPAPTPQHEVTSPLPVSWILAGVVLAAAGAWVAVRGAVYTGEHSRLLTAELLAATVLSPLLLLPTLGAGSMLAQRGQAAGAVTALCGTVLLNLCALLPSIILIDYVVGGASRLREGVSLARALTAAGPTPYPLVVWRVDAVLLVLLSAALVPVAAGRWLPERLESLLLIVVYAAYLVAETLVSVRLMG